MGIKMQYIEGITQYHSKKRTALTLGKFDGLHRGHQKLIERINFYTRQYKEVNRVLVAFDIEREMLLTIEERNVRLQGQVDAMLLCPFTEEMRTKTAEAFIKEVITDRLQAVYLVVGSDFRFGHQRTGTPEMLKEYGASCGFKVEILAPEKAGGEAISSSRIRKELEKGEMQSVNRLLGYDYSLEGMVTYGRQLGRTLGFPTLNIVPPALKKLPPFGVYACLVEIKGEWQVGICNLGIRPTVDKGSIVLAEAHLLDYHGDAYESPAKICLQEFLRPEMTFSSVTELKEQIDKDVQKVRELKGSL